MHAQIEIEYGADSVIRKMTSDEARRLSDTLPALEIPTDPEALLVFSIGWMNREQTIDLTTTGAALLDLGIKFTIKRFTSCYKTAREREPTVNLQVAIPNLLLFSVDEVKVLEDECTDVLQRHLDDKWRILAVCPPACQRRPDYILGRQRDTGGGY